MRGSPGVKRIFASAVVVFLVLAASGCGDGGNGAVGASSSITTTTTDPSAPDVDDLDDGTHQVRVDSVDLTGGTLTIDGVQVMEGMEAVLAYLADTDGAQLEGPQIYVRNGTRAPAELPVDASGSFSVILAESCCELIEVGWSGVANVVSSDFEGAWGNNPPFEVTIEGGEVISASQIHIP